MNLAHAPVVLDVAGLALDADDRRRLAHPLTGGIVLFARNWRDRLQLTELIAEVKAIRTDLLVCVDHEGGRVQRFRSDGFTTLPPMRALGEMWMDDGDGDAARRHARARSGAATGHVLAAELRACGVDLSFTPVLDLDHGGSSVIGDRAFHRDPRVVACWRRASCTGCCRPGCTTAASISRPRLRSRRQPPRDPIRRSPLDRILADDARPYEWLGGALASVMPAHVIYPSRRAPGRLLARWLREILRNQLGFDGAIFSDDLSMAGARRIGGSEVTYAEAAALALSAGCDLVLLCNQSVDGGAAVDALLDELLAAEAAGGWQADPDSDVRRLDLLPQTAPIVWDDLMHDPAYQRSLERLP